MQIDLNTFQIGSFPKNKWKSIFSNCSRHAAQHVALTKYMRLCEPQISNKSMSLKRKRWTRRTLCGFCLCPNETSRGGAGRWVDCDGRIALEIYMKTTNLMDASYCVWRKKIERHCRVHRSIGEKTAIWGHLMTRRWCAIVAEPHTKSNFESWRWICRWETLAFRETSSYNTK